MLTLSGKTYTVPGAYGTVEVVQLGSVALPIFNTLLIIGSAKKGIPTNATGKKGYEVLKPFASLTEAKDFYGICSITDAMEYAKKAGAGVVFCANVASTTLASATIPDNAGVPEDTMDVVPQDENWGAPGNDISITIAQVTTNTTFTLIPPKYTKFLGADASIGDSVLELEDVGNLVVGQTVYINDNAASATETFTIKAIDTTNNKVVLSAVLTAAYTMAEYGRMYQEDLDHQETKTFVDADTTIDDVITWINSGKVLTASRSTYIGVVPDTLTKTLLQNIASATAGVSPAATETADGDYDTFAGSAPQLFEEFRNFYKTLRVRLMNLVTPTATVHAVYKTLAKTLRTQQQSVQLVLGCELADIDKAESDAAHPIKRAKVLNSQDCLLAGDGMDSKASYLTKAPFIAGLLSANSVKRNLTWDTVDALTTEKFFGESNKETDTAKYLANGVLITGTGKNGFYLVKGVNTYQNQANIWNETDDATYLIMQRQIVDFVYQGYKDQMEVGVGGEGFTPTIASIKGLQILDKYKADGFITQRTMAKAYREGNAVITEPEIKPLEADDFVGFKLRVLAEG